MQNSENCQTQQNYLLFAFRDYSSPRNFFGESQWREFHRAVQGYIDQCASSEEARQLGDFIHEAHPETIWQKKGALSREDATILAQQLERQLQTILQP